METKPKSYVGPNLKMKVKKFDHTETTTMEWWINSNIAIGYNVMHVISTGEFITVFMR